MYKTDIMKIYFKTDSHIISKNRMAFNKDKIEVDIFNKYIYKNNRLTL